MFGRRARVAAAWDQVAEALDGRLTRGGLGELVLRAELDGIPVAVEEDLPSATLVHAVAPHHGGLVLRLDRPPDDAARAQAWLWGAGDELAAVDRHYTLELKRGVALARRFGVEADALVLLAAVRGVLALAAGGLRLASAWRDLVDALGGRWRDNRGGWIRGEGSFGVEREGLEIIVECEAPATLVCTAGDDVDRLVSQPGWPALAAEARHADGRLCIAWPGHLPERERIARAIEALVTARAPAPYR